MTSYPATEHLNGAAALKMATHRSFSDPRPCSWCYSKQHLWQSSIPVSIQPKRGSPMWSRNSKGCIPKIIRDYFKFEKLDHARCQDNFSFVSNRGLTDWLLRPRFFGSHRYDREELTTPSHNSRQNLSTVDEMERAVLSSRRCTDTSTGHWWKKVSAWSCLKNSYRFYLKAKTKGKCSQIYDHSYYLEGFACICSSFLEAIQAE